MANSNCPESNLSVIVLAAGKGTRMRSSVPKVLHRLCGLTLLERTLRAVIKLKPRNIFTVVGYQREAVSEAIAVFAKSQNQLETNFHIVTQEPQLGTGHAVQTVFAAHDIQSEYTLILPGDIPLLTTEPLESLRTTCRNQILELGLISFTPPDPALFGRIVRDANGKLIAIREAKDCSPEELTLTEVNSSIYLARTPTLKEAVRHLIPNNFQKELYLTDIVSWSIANNLAVDTHSVNASSTDAQSCPDYLTFAGANSIAELYELDKHRRKQLIRQKQDSGVTIENIDSVYVDEDVVVEQDCFLGANTRLRGRTHIKQGCILHGDCLVDNSTIGENAVIKLGSVIESSAVGANCAVGPYAHLREGSVLQDNVKVGNFVETKKSLLKSGVKAGHLSYLGDSVVGENSNIGAGTITCNYDGAEKHQTIIGQNVFVGSNSALVAPVTIGSDAYVGAGSVITDSIPANSLGVARERQVVIGNWAEKRRKSKVKG